MEQVTIKDIAKICNVGVTTVSRAINDHPDINPQTKERIMDAIREYHYFPNNSARNLKRSENQTIAVLVKGIGNPFFGPIIEVLEREIIRRQFSFVLQQVEEDENEVEAAISLEKEKRLKGIIFLGGSVHHSPDRLRLVGIPSVISTVDTQIPEDITGCAVVTIDDEAESYKMVDHLCRSGHKRIAILTASEKDDSIGRRRLEGYLRALKDHGISPDNELIVRMKQDQRSYTIRQGYEITSRFLEKKADFTCIYAVSDTLAIGALRAVIDAGLKVPGDVCIAGFDGLDIARYYNPAVTTICQPGEEIAAETVRILFDMIEGKETSRRVVFEGTLFKGEST